eukprot:TRINITY_DN4128_c0_g1_i2.p1 TRINITY_DN4128_c0_g1~~TRINITY_DN4128_c0_g1_i2.p1  ORF type:complete len:119 (+),score=17.07 TRINITY_DN4128_c0_g1_i2:229-585(+)
MEAEWDDAPILTRPSRPSSLKRAAQELERARHRSAVVSWILCVVVCLVAFCFTAASVYIGWERLFVIIKIMLVGWSLAGLLMLGRSVYLTILIWPTLGAASEEQSERGDQDGLSGMGL